jgi:hypothetical protein
MATLADASVSEPHRLKLRELLRTIIESIWVLVVPRKSHRFCVAQIFFTSGQQRDYIIHYQRAGYGRQGSWHAKSMMADLTTRKLDLRNRKDVDALLKMLESTGFDLLIKTIDSNKP